MCCLFLGGANFEIIDNFFSFETAVFRSRYAVFFSVDFVTAIHDTIMKLLSEKV